MDWLFLIISGAVIGVVVAAPIGPVNLICIRRTLAHGPLSGFLAGLGAAAGDGVFAAVSAFGLTAVSQMVEGYSTGLEIAGGLILLGFGWVTFQARPQIVLPDEDDATLPRLPLHRHVATIASTFALTVTNPATLVGFAALFTGLGSVVGEDARFIEAGVLVGAVIAGSALWWFALTAFTGLLHGRLDNAVMRRINQGSGLLIGTFGLVVLSYVAYGRIVG
ncbi:MAG: LysE family translocator [Alphaproteobacteria bacterium]|nr:LysE family translocator [Alphaproteobacteria bacterium]